jgi:hypothetical protein
MVVIHCLSVKEFGVTAIRLPFRRRADDDGDRLTLGVGLASLTHFETVPSSFVSITE